MNQLFISDTTKPIRLLIVNYVYYFKDIRCSKHRGRYFPSEENRTASENAYSPSPQ